MATKNIAWNTGSGNINVEYGGSKDGTIIVTSDNNNLYESRSQQIVVKTTDGSNIERTITIQQAAKVRIDISTAIVTAANQTYSGSAKTPTPTVTLNGETIPSSGYDVAYSNNTNAGTATITIAGKGDYTGTATGSFTIAKANRTLSFADNYVVLDTSSNVTKTATPSAGSGDGAITYSISSTTYATINSSSGNVTSKTSDGSAVVTAIIAEGTNYLSATASYNLYVFATTHNYDYNGSYRSVTLPPGTYQFQCWGAQGGSNAAASSYGITSQSGGKGGYSIGQLTVSQSTEVRVYVGGQGSSSSGGFNGGGSTVGSNSISETNFYCTNRVAGGGGATDIRLSDGSLYSRMIVAGGGGGGAMGYRAVTTYNPVQEWVTFYNGYTDSERYNLDSRYLVYTGIRLEGSNLNQTYKFSFSGSTPSQICIWYSAGAGRRSYYTWNPNETYYIIANCWIYLVWTDGYHDGTTTAYRYETVQKPVVTETTYAGPGFYGGGTSGGGSNSGTQSQAGYEGSFGTGANQIHNSYRYISGAGGGGWYGGGCAYKDTDMSYISVNGGGSGWVNTSSSAGNRPSGYSGLQLDSGTTTMGNQSFPATGGGNETGHAGNGYARITRIS